MLVVGEVGVVGGWGGSVSPEQKDKLALTRAKEDSRPVLPQRWGVGGQPLAVNKRAMGRAQVRNIDGSRAVVQDRPVLARGRGVVEHEVGVSRAARDQGAPTADGEHLDRLATA